MEIFYLGSLGNILLAMIFWYTLGDWVDIIYIIDNGILPEVMHNAALSDWPWKETKETEK